LPEVSHNALVITARWVERGAVRYTPAGLPAVDLTLEHLSTTLEAGSPRRVELKLKAVALGPVVQRVQAMPTECPAHWSGFLAPTRNGKGVTMHVTQVDSAV
jgi:primosomal replication protein N